MKHHYLFIILLVLIGLTKLSANEVQKVYDDLDDLRIVPEKIAVVNDFHLKNGKIHFNIFDSVLCE